MLSAGTPWPVLRCGMWPVTGVLIFQAVHRATRYAISRPSRETLFCSVVTAVGEVQGKPVVDVFLYPFR